ncbi:hypothetical protein Plhal710r2_c014g0064201 [Plasmopara halstedii]
MTQLSVTEYRASRPHRTIITWSRFGGVDYESDTSFLGWEEDEGEVPEQRDVTPRPALALRTPCQIPDLSSSMELGIITSDFNEAQKQLSSGRIPCARVHGRSLTLIWNMAYTRQIPSQKQRTLSLDRWTSI